MITRNCIYIQYYVAVRFGSTFTGHPSTLLPLPRTPASNGLLARFAWIFASDGVNVLLCKLSWRCTEAMGWRASTVLGWAGMRGVVTLAVALSVPANLPGRDFLLVAAFAVILITVLVQGTTLGFVIRWLRPPESVPTFLGIAER